MEQIPTQITTCEEKKQYIAKFLKSVLFYIVLFFVFYLIFLNITRIQNNTLKAFNSGEELKCSSFESMKIVSKEKGYYRDTQRSNYITNGDIIYKISRCNRR